MSALLVALGAAVGAVLRHLVGHVTRTRTGSTLPWATLLVNVGGSAALGALLGVAATRGVPDEVVLALGVGLCGAFTTWSTLAWDAVALAEDLRPVTALGWTTAGVAAGVVAAWAGWSAAVALAGG